VFGRLIVRVLDVAIASFAILGFVCVPLGQQTGLEHLRNVLETPAATQAAEGLADALGRAKHLIVDSLRSLIDADPNSEPQPQPQPAQQPLPSQPPLNPPPGASEPQPTLSPQPAKQRP
jgi:hypothetical protein